MLKTIDTVPLDIHGKLAIEPGTLFTYRIHNYDDALLKKLTLFSKEGFGDTGTDVWWLVPAIRHGRAYVITDATRTTIAALALLIRDFERPTTVYLAEFATHKDYRGGGLGAHFLSTIATDLSKAGIGKLSLTVELGNLAARRLYEDKLGFIHVKTVKDCFGAGEDRLVLELPLKKIDK